MSTLSVNSIKDVQSFDFANTSFAGAYGTANSGYIVANAAFTQSNNEVTRLSASYVVANAAFAAANNVAPQVTPAFNTANAAFTKANSALQNTNVTLAGNLTSTGAITLNRFPFYEASANINFDYTINTGMNAFTPGPVTLNSGVTITVPSGSTWTVV